MSVVIYQYTAVSIFSTKPTQISYPENVSICCLPVCLFYRKSFILSQFSQKIILYHNGFSTFPISCEPQLI